MLTVVGEGARVPGLRCPRLGSFQVGRSPRMFHQYYTTLPLWKMQWVAFSLSHTVLRNGQRLLRGPATCLLARCQVHEAPKVKVDLVVRQPDLCVCPFHSIGIAIIPSLLASGDNRAELHTITKGPKGSRVFRLHPPGRCIWSTAG